MTRTGKSETHEERHVNPKNKKSENGTHLTNGPKSTMFQTGLQRLCGVSREANSRGMRVSVLACLRVPNSPLVPKLCLFHAQSGTFETPLSQHGLHTLPVLNIR